MFELCEAKPAAVARCIAALSSANSAQATRHNHHCHICRIGQIREIRKCVSLYLREREWERQVGGVSVSHYMCIIKSKTEKQEDEYNGRLMESVCHRRSLCCASASCHFRFMSATLCLTNRTSPAQHHSWLVSVSRHHHTYTQTRTVTLSLPDMYASIQYSFTLTHVHMQMSMASFTLTHVPLTLLLLHIQVSVKFNFAWPGTCLHWLCGK